MACHASGRNREKAAIAVATLIATLASPLVPSLALGASRGSDAESETTQPQLDFQFVEPLLTLGLRGGYGFNRSNGEIYDFLTDVLTLSHADFDGPVFAIDGSIRITSWLDGVVGLEVSVSRSESEYRAYVYQDDTPIEQETSLIQLPLTFGVKLYPMGRGRMIGRYAWVRSRLVPYLGGGIGATWYKLEQEGDFVDFQTLEIFADTFRSDGWAFSSHAFLGLDLKITRSLGLVVEGRYHWARADLSGSYVDFDRIRLGGPRVMVGMSWRAR